MVRYLRSVRTVHGFEVRNGCLPQRLVAESLHVGVPGGHGSGQAADEGFGEPMQDISFSEMGGQVGLLPAGLGAGQNLDKYSNHARGGILGEYFWAPDAKNLA